MPRWSAGAWLGGQLGGTAWILVAAVLGGWRDAETGSIVFLLFLVPNLIGAILWQLRAHLAFHAAIQLLMPVVGVFGALAVFVLDRAGQWQAIQIGSAVPAGTMYWLIGLVVAGVMLLFYLRFGRSRDDD